MSQLFFHSVLIAFGCADALLFGFVQRAQKVSALIVVQVAALYTTIGFAGRQEFYRHISQ